MISTKGRYAVRVMIDLVKQEQGRNIPLREIADRQEISKKYLEIIMKEMAEAGLLIAASGRGGGYRLARKPEEYPLDEILEIMEGSLSPVACLAGETNTCPRRGQCQTLPFWTEFDELVHNFLHNKKLSDLL